jgi:hypothetical protein
MAVSTGRCGNYGSATRARTHSWHPREADPVLLATRTQADTALTRPDTVRRATSHADPKAAATDGRRNLAAADATTPATPPRCRPLLGSTSP